MDLARFVQVLQDSSPLLLLSPDEAQPLLYPAVTTYVWWHIKVHNNQSLLSLSLGIFILILDLSSYHRWWKQYSFCIDWYPIFWSLIHIKTCKMIGKSVIWLLVLICKPVFCKNGKKKKLSSYWLRSHNFHSTYMIYKTMLYWSQARN